MSGPSSAAESTIKTQSSGSVFSCSEWLQGVAGIAIRKEKLGGKKLRGKGRTGQGTQGGARRTPWMAAATHRPPSRAPPAQHLVHRLTSLELHRPLLPCRLALSALVLIPQSQQIQIIRVDGEQLFTLPGLANRAVKKKAWMEDHLHHVRQQRGRAMDEFAELMHLQSNGHTACLSYCHYALPNLSLSVSNEVPSFCQTESTKTGLKDCACLREVARVDEVLDPSGRLLPLRQAQLHLQHRMREARYL